MKSLKVGSLYKTKYCPMLKWNNIDYESNNEIALILCCEHYINYCNEKRVYVEHLIKDQIYRYNSQEKVFYNNLVQRYELIE